MTEVAEGRRADDVLPHNLEAERSILGGILLDPKALDVVSDILTAEAFFRKGHQHIFTALLSLFSRSQPIDLVSVKEELRRAGHLDDIGGAVYLAGLTDGTPRSVNVGYYAGLVKGRASARAVITLAHRLLAQAHAADSDPAILVDEAERGLLAISSQATPGDLLSSADLVERFFPVVDAMQSGQADIGVSTGFSELDRYTLGFGAGETIILAGLTSSGKTSLAMQIALHVARSVPVAYFSLEMTQKQQMLRIISTLAGVDGHKMRMGRMNAYEQGDVGAAMATFANLKFWLDGTPNVTALQIRSRVRRLRARHGLGLVVVDYLQKMKHPHAERHDLRVAATSEILNTMASELEVPALVLSQFSRGVAKDARRPQLSDLRDSGSIEQDAGMVLLIHRPPAKSDGMTTETPLTELIIAKQRNGPTESVSLRWLGEQYRFTEVTP